MKKNLIFIFLFLVFPISVYADSVELKCINSEDKQIICEINGNSDSTITTVDFNVTTSSNLKLLAVDINEDWKIIENSSNQILLTRTSNTKNFKIAKITVKNENEESGYISVAPIKFKNDNNEEITIDNIQRNVPIPDNDSLIRKIIIDNYLINFRPEVFEYTLKIKKEKSLKITIIPLVEDTKYAVINNHDLDNDDIIEIVTNSATKESSTYTIKIIKDVKQNDPKYMYIFAGVIALIVIINLIRIISDYKEKHKK